MQAKGNDSTVKGLTEALKLVDLSDGQTAPSDLEDRSEFYTFELNLHNKTIPFGLIAKDQPAKLTDLVKISHRICNILLDSVIDREVANCRDISCKKGCSRCCNYMVSLSSAEAFLLHNHILSLPTKERKSKFHAFLLAARKISANRIPVTDQSQISETEELQAISNWFNKLNLTCPFLENDACSIYEIRPLVCREHLVLSDPKGCNPLSNISQTIVDIPFSVAEAMMDFCNQIENTENEAVIMPLAMVWANANQDRMNKKYPAALLAEQFVNIINELSSVSVM